MTNSDSGEEATTWGMTHNELSALSDFMKRNKFTVSDVMRRAELTSEERIKRARASVRLELLKMSTGGSARIDLLSEAELALMREYDILSGGKAVAHD